MWKTFFEQKKILKKFWIEVKLFLYEWKENMDSDVSILDSNYYSMSLQKIVFRLYTWQMVTIRQTQIRLKAA